MIGTARFRLHVPGETERTYVFMCSRACAQRTLQRMARNLVAGAIVDMEWWDADGVPAAGGSLGRMADNMVQLIPPFASTTRLRMQQRPKPAPESLYKQFLSPLVVHHES